MLHVLMYKSQLGREVVQERDGLPMCAAYIHLRLVEICDAQEVHYPHSALGAR